MRETYVPSMVMARENSWSLGGVTSLLARGLALLAGDMPVGLAVARAARPMAMVDRDVYLIVFFDVKKKRLEMASNLEGTMEADFG